MRQRPPQLRRRLVAGVATIVSLALIVPATGSIASTDDGSDGSSDWSTPCWVGRYRVDADWKKDNIDVTSRRSGTKLKVTVERNGRGTMVTKVRGYNKFPAEWTAAATIDNRTGNELLIVRGFRGNTARFAVLTASRGKFRRVPGPEVSKGWTLRTRGSTIDGFDRGKINGHQVLKYNEMKKRKSGGWSGTQRSYRLKKGRWVKVGSRKITAPDKLMADGLYGGWEMELKQYDRPPLNGEPGDPDDYWRACDWMDAPG